jgi:hypothetical protein
MKRHSRAPVRRLAIALAALLGFALFFTACDDHDDHEIPDGQGTLQINNYATGDIRVYINSTEREEVDAHTEEYYDLDPGLYNVLLDQDDGDRSWSDDINILDDRFSILDVRNDPADPLGYRVTLTFD